MFVEHVLDTGGPYGAAVRGLLQSWLEEPLLPVLALSSA
jgi:hypothetical protein